MKGAALLTITLAVAGAFSVHAQAKKSQWLERFEGPLTWTSVKEKDGQHDYAIATENGQSFLHANYLQGTDGNVLSKKMHWNTKDLPYLRWKWRVNTFPKGALIMDDDKSDAAAQVYVSWRIGGRAYALKYFWSVSEAVGTSFHAGRWNPIGRYFAQIIRMGGDKKNWVTETRNIVEDYKKAYGKDPPDEAVGLAVLTDGDQTKSESQADYTDFEALSQP